MVVIEKMDRVNRRAWKIQVHLSLPADTLDGTLNDLFIIRLSEQYQMDIILTKRHSWRLCI